MIPAPSKSESYIEWQVRQSAGFPWLNVATVTDVDFYKKANYDARRRAVIVSTQTEVSPWVPA